MIGFGQMATSSGGSPKIVISPEAARTIKPIQDVAPPSRPPVPSYVWIMAGAFALGGLGALVMKRMGKR